MNSDDLLQHIDQRLSDSDRAQERRHQDVIRRLETSDQNYHRLHGRVSTLEGVIRTLQRSYDGMASTLTSLPTTIELHVKAFMGQRVIRGTDADGAPMWKLDAKAILGIVAATTVAILSFLKFIGKLG